MKDYKPNGGKMKADQITLDHIIPLGKKGTNRHDNLVAACYSCNALRNDMELKINQSKVQGASHDK